MKLVECVPNFSEGRDRVKIKTITDAISAVSGITILDVDPGQDTNRTVVTFVGNPEAVAEAAFQGIKTASQVLDMRVHKGAHARMGSTDVCPFIPISGITVEECVDLSKQVGKRVGEELNIPVYLYEYSAQLPERKNLAVIRQGEYEGLAKKLKNSLWKPDFGSAKFNAVAGAVVIGVRDFLIAYNINLNTRDQRLATDIAFELREKGRSHRAPNPNSPNLLDGSIIRYQEGALPCAFCNQVSETANELVKHSKIEHNHDVSAVWQENGYDEKKLAGRPVKKPGLFKDVKAVGWYIGSFKRAQISINFINYKVSSIQDVFDATCRLAEERGIRVTGSELVGLIPLDAILSSGRYYLKKQRCTTGVPEADIIETAVQSLGLNDVTPFIPEEKIIEFAVRGEHGNLISMTSSGFLNELSSNIPAPGGGSVAALAGSLGSALVSMVAALSHEKKGFESLREELESWGNEAQKIKDRLSFLVDEDTNAFNKVLDAKRLNASSEAEIEAKTEALMAANKYAIEVPLEVAHLSYRVIELSAELVEKGNPNSVSDVGVAAEMGLSAVRGAVMNVLINLPELGIESYAAEQRTIVESLLKKSEKLHKFVFKKTLHIIGSN